MDVLEEFEEELRDALSHLYDPIYQPSEILWAVTGCEPEQGVETLQAAIIQAIEDLKPAASVPPDARVRRVYDVLHDRYVQRVTQAEVASRLGISPRYLRRQQVEAVHVLASLLREHSRAGGARQKGVAAVEAQRRAAVESVDASAAWRSQVRRELASLRKSGPGALADVGKIIEDARDIGYAITSKHGLALEAEAAPSGLLAIIHPAALRQIILEAIVKLSQRMSSGKIAVRAERVGEPVTITVKAAPASADRPPDLTLIEEILAAHDGSLEIRSDDDRLSLLMKLRPAPSISEKVALLVIDDNEDLIDLYRSYTTKTRYEIAQVTEGRRVFQAVEAYAPDIIVLDVMLPDVDGWKLLMKMHEHPTTRSIPIVVCSVVREEELALALGATLYLAKPVRRQQFLQALDDALSRTASRGLGGHASSPATY